MANANQDLYVGYVDPMFADIGSLDWTGEGQTFELVFVRNHQELLERIVERGRPPVVAVVSLRTRAISQLVEVHETNPDLDVLVTLPENQSPTLMLEAADLPNVRGCLDGSKLDEVLELIDARLQGATPPDWVGPPHPTSPAIHHLWRGEIDYEPLPHEVVPRADKIRIALAAAAMAYDHGSLARMEGVSTDARRDPTKAQRKRASEVGQFLWIHAAKLGYIDEMDNRYLMRNFGDDIKGGESSLQDWVRATKSRLHIIELVLREGDDLPLEMVQAATEEYPERPYDRVPQPDRNEP